MSNSVRFKINITARNNNPHMDLPKEELPDISKEEYDIQKALGSLPTRPMTVDELFAYLTSIFHTLSVNQKKQYKMLKERRKTANIYRKLDKLTYKYDNLWWNGFLYIINPPYHLWLWWKETKLIG